MFDLFRSRDKAVRILLGAILVIVALSMVTYLIPGGPGAGTGGNQDNLVAQIGDEQVTVRNVQVAMANVSRGGQVPAGYLAVYAPQIIQGLINERAIAYEAKRLGIQVSDEDVNVAIQNQMPPGFFQDGKLVKKDVLESMLAQQNLTVADLKNDIHRQLMGTRLRDIVLEGTVVSPAEIEQEFRKRGEKVKVDYVLVSPAKFKGDVKIDEAQLKQHYDKNRSSFQTPAKRSMALIVFDPAQIENTLPVTDADLQKAYNTNSDKYRVPERAMARHILLKTDAAKNDDAAVKAKAEALLKQIRSGGDFAELAKKNSQDPGSGAKGGDLGWVMRGQMVKPFEDAVFSLKPGEVSNLVKTQYGYHIVQVQSRENAHLRTFEEVKPELSTAYKKQRVNDVMQQLADKAALALRRDPTHPEKAAEDVKQQLVRVDNVLPGDPLPQIGVSKEFDQATAGLQKNDVSQPVVVGGNKIAIAVVTNVTPAHPSSFEEAQPEVRKALEAQSLELLLSQKASELMAKTKQMDGDLKKAAQSMGLEAKTTNDFDRNGAVEGVGSASMLAEAFAKPVGSIIGPISAQDSRVIAKVVAKTPANVADLANQTASIRDEIKSKRARERNQLFEAGVRGRLEQSGKIKVQQDVVNRLVASYSRAS